MALPAFFPSRYWLAARRLFPTTDTIVMTTASVPGSAMATPLAMLAALVSASAAPMAKITNARTDVAMVSARKWP
jgi:hypothetical protein